MIRKIEKAMSQFTTTFIITICISANEMTHLNCFVHDTGHFVYFIHQVAHGILQIGTVKGKDVKK